MTTTDRMTFWWKTSVVCLVISIVVYRVSYTLADPDLWGHVRFGLDIMRDGVIRQIDAYSYLSDQDWINHEWLCEVLFGLAFKLAGPQGLIALKLALSLLLFGLLYRHLCKQGFGVFRAGMVVILVLYPALVGLVVVRPHLFTYFGFLLMLMIVVAAEQGRKQWLWAAAPLLCIWTNLHGGFLAGGGILGIWLIAAWTQSMIDRVQGRPTVPVGPKAFAAVALAALSTLLNPYGPRLLQFLLETAFTQRPEIGEWRPLYLNTLAGGAYLLLVAISLFALARTRRPRRLGIVVPFVVTVLLPLLSVRHLPLFAIAVGVLLAEHLADAISRHRSEGQLGGGGDRLRVPFLGAAMLVSALLLFRAVPDLSCIEILLFDVPAQSVELLKNSGVEGRIATYFNWGEYVIWHLGPRLKVSMDGRRETVYSEEIRAQDLNFTFGLDDWDALLDQRRTDLVLVSKKKPVYNLMLLKPGWTLVHEESSIGLFGRQDWPELRKVQETPVPDLPDDGKGLCFP